MSPLDLLRGRFGRARRVREAREEMESHLAHLIDDLVAEGVPADEARRRAEAEFGDVERLAREAADAHRRSDRRRSLLDRVDTLRQDLAFAGRQLLRNPGFAATAVATIGLGIAATATVAGVLRAVVLEPLPFDDPDRLVLVEERTPAGHDFSVSEPAYLDWRAQSEAFTDVAAASQRSGVLRGAGEPRMVTALWASASLLPVLGVEPALGRGIAPEEDRAGARARVVVLSDRLWRDAFAADPGVVGRDVVVNDEAHRVVGVLPPDLPYLQDADLVVPLGADPSTSRGEHYLDVVARLAPGVELDDARTAMAALAERLGEAWPEDRGWGTVVTPFRDVFVGPELTRAGWVLLAASGLLLLIACVNVSNLLLARATTRRTEIGVRLALGAGRGRVTRQLFTESLVLAGLGAALGLALTRAAMPFVRGMGAGRIPRLEHATVGLDVLLVCVAAAVAAAVVFGLAPALELRRSDPGTSLRSGARGGSRRRGARGMLVAGQVALSVVLLVGTGLLARSFARLASVDPGFEPDGTLTVRLAMPHESYDPETRVAIMRALLDEVEAAPGIRAAGATAVDPFGGFNLMNNVARTDRMPDRAQDFPAVAWRVVTPGWTEAMGVDLLAGRAFEDGDDWNDAGTPVLINEALLGRLWPEGGIGVSDVLDRTLVWGDPDGSLLRIVGVVGDVRDWRLEEEPMPVVYRPYEQIPWTVMTVVARTEGPAGPAMADAFRDAIRSAEPGLPVPEVRSLDAHMGEAVATPRFHALLLAVFAASGLALAAIGVYGVTAFDVSRRFREIGIRLAVGGSPDGVRRLVFVDTLRLALIGAVVGAIGAWIAARWLESLLYETSARDPLTWGTALGVIALVAVAAAWFPSGRATRVAPREVLTGE